VLPVDDPGDNTPTWVGSHETFQGRIQRWKIYPTLGNEKEKPSLRRLVFQEKRELAIWLISGPTLVLRDLDLHKHVEFFVFDDDVWTSRTTQVDLRIDVVVGDLRGVCLRDEPSE